MNDKNNAKKEKAIELLKEMEISGKIKLRHENSCGRSA